MGDAPRDFKFPPSQQHHGCDNILCIPPPLSHPHCFSGTRFLFLWSPKLRFCVRATVCCCMPRNYLLFAMTVYSSSNNQCFTQRVGCPWISHPKFKFLPQAFASFAMIILLSHPNTQQHSVPFLLLSEVIIPYETLVTDYWH